MRSAGPQKAPHGVYPCVGGEALEQPKNGAGPEHLAVTLAGLATSRNT